MAALVGVAAVERSSFYLVDVARWCGVGFVHASGRQGRPIFGERLGGGGTLFDADGDGDMDLYLVTSHGPRGRPGLRAANRLYLNDGDGFFSEAQACGADISAVGLGAISFDADGDGDQDLYVTNRGPNVMLRNVGSARFADVTVEAGVGDRRWSSGAAAADYDGDGDLDLYVANYVEHHPAEVDDRGFAGLMGPQYYPAQPNSLYRNEGDGTFIDVAPAVGVDGRNGKSLGVAFVDLDVDGRPDIYVANDTTANFLFHNLAGRRFEEIGVASGTALGPNGAPEAGMGVAIGDYDGDLLPDIFVTNYSGETNDLFRNLGRLRFERTTDAAGLSATSLPWLGFGADFADLDDDGDLDLLVANGHVVEDVARFSPGETYAQAPQLFVNDGAGRFAAAGVRAGVAFARPIVGRGTIRGDIDSDGDLDIVLIGVDGPVVMLANVAAAGGARTRHFLTLTLMGAGANRDAIGARVVVTAAGRSQLGQVLAGTSYLSDADPRLHFGLGSSPIAERVVVRWPSGAEQQMHDVEADQFLTVVESVAP